jgi:hypothetical protein
LRSYACLANGWKNPLRDLEPIELGMGRQGFEQEHVQRARQDLVSVVGKMP